jgi:lysyl-tRNA synthetase class II
MWREIIFNQLLLQIIQRNVSSCKEHRENPELTGFELMVCGKEIANAYSELNDPIDQGVSVLSINQSYQKRWWS